MAAPTFVAAYNSVYNTFTTPKTVSVTTQAGDIVVVYGGIENGNAILSTPTGNSLTYSLQQSVAIDINWASAYVWTATDSTGGTNWTLSVGTGNDLTKYWGFGCLVFRNSGGIGASDKTNINGSGPSLNLVTTQDNSAVVVLNVDWNALDGSSRTWRTVNSITPSSGNGLETIYALDTSHATYYGAYYSDVGTAGSKTVGLSAPGGQKYSMVALEVKGISNSTIPLAWVQGVNG